MGTNPDRSQMKWYIGDILDNEEDSWNVPGNFENRLPFDPTYLQERPSSAPPIFVADQNLLTHHNYDVQANEEYRMQPEYVPFYHSVRRLNPRLPPPVHTNNASRNPWESKGNDLDTSPQTGPSENTHLKPISLVDKIQSDFPRTPSPILSSSGQVSNNQDPVVTSEEVKNLSSSMPIQHPQPKSVPQNSKKDIESEFSKLNLRNNDQKMTKNMVNDPMYSQPQFAYIMEGDEQYIESENSSLFSQEMGPMVDQRYSNYAHNDMLRFFADVYTNNLYTREGFDMPPQTYTHAPQPSTNRRSTPTYVKGYSQSVTSSHSNIPTQMPTPQNGPVKGPSRSPLLEEFRTTRNNKKYDLKDIVGHFVEFSGDQYGSRFIQQKLETATATEKQMVFKEISPHALHLMTDVFGNYVIQKFFEHGTAEQRKTLGNVLKGNVLTLSLQMYGCRVVQKALEVISFEQQGNVVRELEDHVLKCIKDQNGNHVIQKVIEQVPANLVLFIIETFQGKVYSLATHPYGCRVVQRILEHCSSHHHQKMINDPILGPGIKAQLNVLKELLESTSDLVVDQYGNYVIQHVLEHGHKDHKKEIIRHLSGQILKLSQHKFASNVIEKCVQYGSKEDRNVIFNEVIAEPKKKNSPIPLEIMMNNPYANYVVQRIIDVSDATQKELLIAKIKPHVASLKKYTYGKHIISRLEKIVGMHL